MKEERKKKSLFGTGEEKIGVGVREQWTAVSKSKALAVQPLSQNSILPSTQLVVEGACGSPCGPGGGGVFFCVLTLLSPVSTPSYPSLHA